MTPEQFALFEQVLAKGKTPAPAPAPAPRSAPKPAPKPAPVKERSPAMMALIQGLPPHMREAFIPALSDPSTRKLDPSKIVGDTGQTLQNQEAIKAVTQPRVAPSKPDEVTQSELEKATEALQKEGYLAEVEDAPAAGSANELRATVGSAESGVQPRENLRLMPMQKLSGQYGVSPNAMRQALVLKYFKRMQQREALPGVDKMTPEQYQQTLQRAEEEARRFVTGVVGASEAEGNMLVPMDSIEDRASAIRRGEDMPAPMKLAMSGQIAGMKLGEYLTGVKPDDSTISAVLSPIWALSRAGQVATPRSLEDLTKGGSPVEREGKFSWITRLGPLSAYASWFLDPELTWELGGESGLGGQKHIEKVVGGYDIMRELPRLGEAYAEITPWEDSKGAKIVAAAIPLGAAILMEPDAISIGTGLVAAPVVKGVKALKLGKHVLGQLVPQLEAWAKVLEETGDIEEVAKLAGRPGSPGWILFQAMKGDLLARGWSSGADVGKLNPNDLSGFEAAMAGLQKELDEANTALGGAHSRVSEGVAKTFESGKDEAAEVAGAQAAGAQRLNAAQGVVDAAQRKALQELQPLIQETTEARKAFNDAEGQFVGMARLREVAGDAARPGGQARPGRDTTEILAELARMKQERSSLLQQLELAKASKNPAEVARIKKAIAGHKSPLIENVTELLESHVTANYMHARKAMGVQLNKLARARAKVSRLTTGEAALKAEQAGGRVARDVVAAQARGAARVTKIVGAIDRAIDSTGKAMNVAEAATRQKQAMESLPAAFGDVIKYYQQGVKFSQQAIERGTFGASELGKSVLDTVATRAGKQYEFDGTKYYGELVQRYGVDAVQDSLQMPGTKWASRFMSGKSTVPVGTMRELRKFEEAAHAASETRRLAPGAEVRTVLRTVGESPLARGWSQDAWAAWTYQIASRMGRNSDRISASIIGKAPAAVQALVRRSYGRYHASELELDQAAAKEGIAGMREFLTSGTPKFGTVSNQDTMTHAEKALSFLRALASGSDEAWSADVVVDALSRAPLPGWFQGAGAAGNVRGALKAALMDQRMTGASLVQWLEKVPPGIFGKRLGTADASQVQFRFISRAIIHASNQHDSLYDVMRLAGPGIDAAAARSLNFMISRDIKDLTRHSDISAAAAARAADTYGLPYLSETAGKLRHLFAANTEQVKLLHAATIEGHEHWIPYTLWRALNEVPFKLSKELKEFAEEPGYISSGFDKMSRLWRIATVNGWILPRAAHFTNTLFGDWSQMVQSLGWRQGSRLALRSLPTYLPFVGRALQDRLTAGKGGILPAMFGSTMNRVLHGTDDFVVDTLEGPLTAKMLKQEAWEDGCWDSISTRDLQEATARRGMAWWKRVAGGEAPPLIQRSAKMMEEVQARNRLALYIELRNGGLSREKARARLNEALYDWSTGVPEWEMQTISRVAAFWTYRRSMLKQLGGSITEAFTTPAAEYWPKALTGRTKVARMRQMATAVQGIPEAIYWEDPDELIDDAEQYRRYALHSAPWWVKAQAIIANREVNPSRKLWYSDVAGRDVTYESLMLPALTTMDQLYLLNMFVQTSMASAVMAAEKAGMKPSMTTIDAREIWERNVDAFSDTMMPGFDEATNNLLRGVAGRSQYTDPRGTLVPQAQAVMLHRSGFGSFMAAQPDADGAWRIDPGAYGLFTSLAMAFPPAADIARNWVIFADNPGYQEGVATGLTESLQRWVGFKPAGFNPAASRDYEVDDQQRKLKEEASALRKQTEPKRKF